MLAGTGQLAGAKYVAHVLSNSLVKLNRIVSAGAISRSGAQTFSFNALICDDILARECVNM